MLKEFRSFLFTVIKGSIYAIVTIIMIVTLTMGISTVVYGESNRIANLFGDTILVGTIKALSVALVDSSGNQISAIGGGGMNSTTADTLRVISISTNECDIIGETASGAKVISKTIGGVGCPQVGQTITGTALAGNSDTIAGVSAQPSEIPIGLGTITADTHTNTTLDDIATRWCSQIKAYMWVSAGTNIKGIAVNGHMDGDPGDEPTYTTTDCAAGSVTLSQAATGTDTATGTGYVFSPAIITTTNLDEDHITFTTMATLQSGANVDVLTAKYLIATGSNTTAGSFTHTPDSGYTVTSSDSGSLPNGSIQSVSVYASTGSPEWGAIYACVQLVRSAAVIANLVCGSPTANKPIIYPGPSVESANVFRYRTFAQLRPTTGTPLEMVIPANVMWEPVAGQILFQTSATAGARNPAVAFVDKEGITAWSSNLFVNQPMNASETISFMFGAGVVQSPDYPSIMGSNDVSSANFPSADTPPVVTMADPGDGYRNVVDCVYGTLEQTNATTGVLAEAGFVLRDGATGAGTIKYGFTLAVKGVTSGTLAANLAANGGDTATGGQCGLDMHMTSSTVTTFETSTITGSTGIATATIKGHVELVTPIMKTPTPLLRLVGGGLARIRFQGDNGLDDVWTEAQIKVKEIFGVTF